MALSCRASGVDQCLELGVERTQTGHAATAESDPMRTCARSVWRLTIWMPEEQAALPGLHFRHSGAAADPGPLIRRTLLEIRAIKSSILERNIFRIGDVFAL